MNREEFLFRIFVALLCVIQASQNVLGQGANSSFTIEQGDFSCGRNLLCSGNATTTAGGILKLTPDPRPRSENYTYFLSTVGAALSTQPVQLVNTTTKQLASFSINFSLRIEGGPNGAGDGMAFVMFGNKTWVGNAGSALGAYRSDGMAGVDTLAVEFDTFRNLGIDNDNNHVGIDTTSTTSAKARSVPFSLTLERVYTWVDYNSLTFTLDVRVDNTAQKPEQPFISYTIDLRDVFEGPEVWVGFSGTNGGCTCFSYYSVYDLSVNSSFPSLLPPASPPQAPPVLSRRKSSSRVSSGLLAVVGVAIAGIVIGACFFVLFRVRGKRKGRIKLTSGDSEGTGDGSMAQEFQMAGLSHSLKMYNYNELCAATDNFSDAVKLGEGGFGSVYRGSIPGVNTELLVAVKKLSRDSKQGEREFVAEVSTIGMLRHRNIVHLLGWCCESPGQYLLVYEFMRNGSLDRHLYPRAQTLSKQEGHESVLSWEKRFKILGGLAAGLQYLHEGWRQQVIHRDVKSSNVMLDDNFNAMLGDFGLARMADHDMNPATTEVAGTYGFIAPEASMTGKFTAKADVYAFGAVCLETVCGRKVYDVTRPPEEILLVDHVWGKLSEDVELFSVVDGKLEGNYEAQQVEVVLLLGLLCSHPNPDERPDMRRVVEILGGRVEMPPIPKTKPQPEYYSYSHLEYRRRFFLQGSETDAVEIEHQYQVHSQTSISKSTSTNGSRPRSSTRSSHSGLSSSADTSSSMQPSGHGDPEHHS